MRLLLALSMLITFWVLDAHAEYVAKLIAYFAVGWLVADVTRFIMRIGEERE